MLGLDPELAIVSRKTGKGRSAHTFLNEKQQYYFAKGDTPPAQGPKEKTGKHTMLGSEMDRDGAVLEVRSLVNSSCRDNIIPYVAEAMRRTQLDLNKAFDSRFTMSSRATIELDAQSFKGDVPSDVVELGCAPDIDAYSLDVKTPELEDGDRRRFTGGHIHTSNFGYMAPIKNDAHEQASVALVYDAFIGLPLVGILGNAYRDEEVERRQFYGQAGSYRFDAEKNKLEYRVPSGRLLISPLVLGWAMGMTKVLTRNVGSGTFGGSYKTFAKAIDDEFSLQDIRTAINTHDVEFAKARVSDMFKWLPLYQENASDLANKMGGGGGGTTNPYFYETAYRVFENGNEEGLGFKDDLEYTWGLYDNYIPRHHSYWGIQVAMAGLVDEDIFPQRALLPQFVPDGVLQTRPTFTHPFNGGQMKYVTPSAVNWLA